MLNKEEQTQLVDQMINELKERIKSKYYDEYFLCIKARDIYNDKYKEFKQLECFYPLLYNYIMNEINKQGGSTALYYKSKYDEPHTSRIKNKLACRYQLVKKIELLENFKREHLQ